jgi:hypothetical protein
MHAYIYSVINCKLCRKKSSSKNRRLSDFAVSANMAYGKITVKPVGEGVDRGDLEYENPDKIVMTEASTYESTQSSIPEAPEYASMEESDTVDAT